ncbi:MAG TPA: DUF2169 domain-containing protein [Polyangia bacterium]|jgi:hypothetical protein|nr:DUF2169 domain-containing protein [Polyangia bacterium]
MLQLENQTPFSASLVPMNDASGTANVIAIVKATYDVEAGRRLKLADEQRPIELVDRLRGEPGLSSVIYESDVALVKPGTDLVLVGDAHAPGGRTVTELDVHFGVDRWEKSVRVMGDRAWYKAGREFRATSPLPFATMPLVYERAFGGTDTTSPDLRQHAWEPRNPVGTGFRSGTAALEGHPLPNLEDPRAPIRAWTDRPAPQGFGFIGRHWSPRAAFAGTYDGEWERTRAPLLPTDFDNRYFQAAAPGLIATPCLHGGERVRARHVSSSAPLIEVDLPGHRVAVAAHFRTGPTQLGIPLLDTLVLFAGEAQLVLVWRAHFVCPGALYNIFAVEVSPEGSTPRRPGPA